jgi:hypothetical protein
LAQKTEPKAAEKPETHSLEGLKLPASFNLKNVQKVIKEAVEEVGRAEQAGEQKGLAEAQKMIERQGD